MHPLDIAVIVIYGVGCTSLGSWLGREGGGVTAYFLGERNIPAWAVMISIVATETSAATFLSVPGIAYHGDWTFLQFAIGYIVARILVAVILLPSYFRGQIQTAYEVLALRFGGSVRTSAAILFLFGRTIGSALRLLLAARVLGSILHWEIGVVIVAVGGITIVYTYLGGLRGVVWADVLQFSIYLGAAAVAVAILGSKLRDGWAGTMQQAASEGRLRILNLSTDLSATYTLWTGLIGMMVLDMGTHGADHMMVQRYLAARSQRQAAGALIASGFVILAQFALFLLIGTGIFYLDQQIPPSVAPGKDREFASFILAYFPAGLLGLVIAAVFSVTMSTVSGALSASASSTVNDLIRPVFPKLSDRGLFVVSRGTTLFWGVVQIVVAIGAIGLGQRVVDSALTVAGLVVGILLGLFLLGLGTRNVGSRAAMIGTIAGSAVVFAVWSKTRIAYPWYALVGSTTVVVVGVLASWLLPREFPSKPLEVEV